MWAGKDNASLAILLIKLETSLKLKYSVLDVHVRAGRQEEALVQPDTQCLHTPRHIYSKPSLWLLWKCPFVGSTGVGGMGCWKGVFHSHFSHSLPMAVRPKKGQSTISIKVLTKQGSTSSGVGTGAKAPCGMATLFS